MQTDRQDIEKRRGAASAKLLELRTRQGMAVLDGKPVDGQELAG